jgi:RNA polymerase sigma-70 factor (ECF subfamily)
MTAMAGTIACGSLLYHQRDSFRPIMPDPMETTLDLLARARAGDRRSLDALFERCLPPLRRWARGRLPAYARDLADTQDLVQETVLHTLHRLSSFQPQHQGALQAYLRQAVANRIRDEIRRVQRRPSPVELDDVHADGAPSPLEHAIGREGIERYEAALARLKPSDREAIVARMELQQSYEEVATALGKPNANAARVAVTRALARLIEEMDRER